MRKLVSVLRETFNIVAHFSLKNSEVKMGEEVSRPGPQDPCRMVYAIFVWLGIGTLLPWNMFITVCHTLFHSIRGRYRYLFRIRIRTDPDPAGKNEVFLYVKKNIFISSQNKGTGTEVLQHQNKIRKV